MCGHTRDPIIYSKFHLNPFRGFGAPGGQNLAFPITLASRFYNSLYYRTSRDIAIGFRGWLYANIQLCACRRSLWCLSYLMASVEMCSHQQRWVEIVLMWHATCMTRCVLSMFIIDVVTVALFPCCCLPRTLTACHAGLKIQIFIFGQNITRNCSMCFIIAMKTWNVQSVE